MNQTLPGVLHPQSISTVRSQAADRGSGLIPTRAKNGLFPSNPCLDSNRPRCQSLGKTGSSISQPEQTFLEQLWTLMSCWNPRRVGAGCPPSCHPGH